MGNLVIVIKLLEEAKSRLYETSPNQASSIDLRGGVMSS